MERPNKSTDSQSPEPEVLKPRSGSEGATQTGPPRKATDVKASTQSGAGQRFGRRVYRPSHKATFIGISVVLVLLIANAAVITFLIQRQAKTAQGGLGSINLNKGLLDQLGVSNGLIGTSGTQLVVTPNAQFKGDLEVGGNVNINKDLKLNSKFTANNAALAQLQAGDTSVTKINVNGEATASTLSLRSDLQVAGLTRLQGAVTVSSLMTVNNSLNVAGNLTVGGVFSSNNISARSLTSTSTLTIGGHVITNGFAPSAAAGPCVGGGGTISISGNDASGTVAINTGGGPCSGVLINVAFRSNYGTTPHVVISPVGRGMTDFYVNRSAGGFSIGGSPVAGAGYVFDYIVEQ